METNNETPTTVPAEVEFAAIYWGCEWDEEQVPEITLVDQDTWEFTSADGNTYRVLPGPTAWEMVPVIKITQLAPNTFQVDGDVLTLNREDKVITRAR